MTIKNLIKQLFFVSFFVSFFLFTPVQAQVFNVFPTNTPLPKATQAVALSITPSGPVNKIPLQGVTGIYVDNATDTAIARDGNTMFIGGIFTEVKLGSSSAVPRTRLAALDVPKQEVLPWNPAPNDRIESLAVDKSTLYVGGRFTEIDNQPRSYLASFDKQTLGLTSWRPDPNDQVNALHADDNKVWVGGRFTAIAGQNKLHLAAFNKPNNVLDLVNLDANGEVYTLAGNATTLYVGGAFTEIAGVKRQYIAAIDKSTGKVTDWNPQLNNEVRRLSIVDNNIVASGPFTILNGTEVINYNAVIDPSTGAVSNVQPVNVLGTPVPATTLTVTVKVDLVALGFQIPNLGQVLTFVIRMFFVIGGLITLFYLLLGALAWVTSGGDEEKVAAARKKMVAAIVGIILVVVVLSIVVTLEQVVFREKICFGLSCAASIPSLIQPL